MNKPAVSPHAVPGCALVQWHLQGLSNRQRRVAGLHLWVQRDAQFDRKSIAHRCPRRITLFVSAYEELPLTGRLMGSLVRSMTSWPHSSRNATPLSHRTGTPCVYLWLYTSPRAAKRPCDGRHQKDECDTSFFVRSLVRRYRIDALALPLVCFASHRCSRTVLRHAQRTRW
jgi:hypothetical protein